LQRWTLHVDGICPQRMSPSGVRIQIHFSSALQYWRSPHVDGVVHGTEAIMGR
jgi:hypothetical protein